ncbi:p-nitrobenzoate reductase, partial [Burkholderia sp. TJI49]
AARERQVAENFRLFGAPHVALLTIPTELGPYAALDCGAFVASFLLAARAHGVATTAQAALAHHARFIRRYFGIGDERRFVCGIAFGYADTTHPANAFRSTRAATADVMQMV